MVIDVLIAGTLKSLIMAVLSLSGWILLK